MTLSAEFVSEQTDAFPITAHVTHHLYGIYHDDWPEISEWKYHKEDRVEASLCLDGHDRDLIHAKVEKHPHPLEDVCPCRYNPITKQIAPAEVNVVDSIEIVEEMEREYIASLPNGFYNLINTPIKTMSLLKKQIMGKSVRPVTDLKSIFPSSAHDQTAMGN